MASDPEEQTPELTDQQPEGSNHGYTVLITLCDKLISGLSREPKALAYTLLGKGFLPQEKVEEIVQIPATDTQNARKIYDVVLGCVQHFPNRYIDFLSVLKGKGLLYGDLLTALKKAYLKLDPSAQLDQSPSIVISHKTTSKQTGASSSICLKSRVTELERTFRDLAGRTFDYLDDRSVTISKFKGRVACLGVELRASTLDYLDDCFGKLSQTSMLSDLWLKLTGLWDFLNYEFLEHVIEIFIPPDSSIHSDLCTYIQKVVNFSSTTKVCEFFEAWPFRMKKPEEAKVKKMVVKADRSWEECTLQDVKETTNTLAQLFSLPRPFLLLRDVEEGCVSILWFVPPTVADSLEKRLSNFESKLISNEGFLAITIDDLQVYPITSIRQCTLHLQTMYKQMLTNVDKAKQKALAPFKFALIAKDKLYGAHDQFTKKTLRGDEDDVLYKKSPTTINSLCTLPDGSPARLVLLEGAPGSGKTTFSYDAVVKWMRNEIFTDISLLALFPLRDYNLRKVTNIHNLIALITPEYGSLVEELEANEGEKMAFWLDGWDEIASSLDGHSSIYEQLVSGNILPKAKVIVTSRSWATDYIKKQLDQQPSQHIEIVSSYQDQIDWLLELKKRELPTKSTSVINDFLKYLEETPAVQGNMHTPFATQITLEVYQWSQESGSPLPTTVTQLYTSYTCLCIHKYLDNHSHFEPKMWTTHNFRDLPEPLRSWFVSLCRLALDGLEDGQRLVFPDVPNHLRLETLGLMQAQAPLYASEESAVVSYHYEHLTLQEFLSALFLSWMSDEERSEIVESCVSDGRYTMTLRFLSGLTKSSSILRNHMRRMLDCTINSPLCKKQYSKEDKDKLTVFHWLFEGGDKATIADILRGRKITVRSHYSWSALDYFVTGHYIARSNCSWSIDFWNSHMGDEKFTQFLQALSSADHDGDQGNGHIVSIQWKYNELTSQSFCHLQDIPTHFLHHLKCFDISNNNLDPTAVDHIAKTIPHMSQLEELKLNFNFDIQRGGAVSLVSALCDHKALKSLHLHATNVGEEDCKQLAHLLSSSKCLEELYVSNNSLSSDSVHFLFKGLQQNSSLKQLYIGDLFQTLIKPNHISLKAMKTLSAYLQDKEKCKLKILDLTWSYISSDTAVELAHGLSQNCSVKVLYLSDNPIGDEGAAALGQAITGNETITELKLDECDITTTGVAALAASLMVNSTIEELGISGNSLGGAILSIAQALEHNETLKRLDIHNDESLNQSKVDRLLNSFRNNTTLEELTLPLKFKVDTDRRVKWR